MAYQEFAYFYDEFNGAADYDALFAYVTGELKAHGIQDGIVADFGCGTGELTKELARVKGMLSNEKFVSKAPAAKVEEEKKKLEKYTAMAAIVVAVVIIALSIVQKVYPLSAYPVLLILFLGKNLLDFRSVASDDKTNSRNAVEYYKKSYPEDSSAKNSSEGKTADKLAGWFLIAKRTAIRTGKLGTGSKAAASGEEVRPSRAIRRGSPGRTLQRRRGRR